MKIHRDSLNQCPRAFHLEVERQKRSSVRLERELSNLLFKYPSAQTSHDYAPMWTNWLTALLSRA